MRQTEIINTETIAETITGASEKLKALLRSRRFWTCIATTTATGALYSLGEIDGAQFTNAMTLIAGIYIGSVALEDGLRNLVTLWLREPADRP